MARQRALNAGKCPVHGQRLVFAGVLQEALPLGRTRTFPLYACGQENCDVIHKAKPGTKSYEALVRNERKAL